MKDYELSRSIIALSQTKGLGRSKIQQILTSVPNINDVRFFELIEVGIELKLLSKTSPIGTFLDARNRADDIIAHCDQKGIHIINRYSRDFPEALKFDCGPFLIYYQGDLSLLNQRKRAAVIGTRVPTNAGISFSRWAGEELAKRGFVVISGLAIGCDRNGHEGCLDAGGKTLAFLPSSIHNIMPKENIDLAKRIVDEGGCIISEYSLYDTPNAGMFIERDRLQAAASAFIIASEFAKNSGTLHTMQYATEYHTPVILDCDVLSHNQGGRKILEGERIDYTAMAQDDIIKYMDSFEMMS